MKLSVCRKPGALKTGLVAAFLALGWGVREVQFAQAQGKRLANATVNSADVPATDAESDGKKVGRARVLLDGSTPSTQSMQVGRFTLSVGATPHPPHKHPEEELLIVTRGTGEVFCDGKTVAVKAGAVMYADPNIEHGIKNTGTNPLEFYWVKYVPAKQ